MSVALSGPWILHRSSVPLLQAPSFSALRVGRCRTLSPSLCMALSQAQFYFGTMMGSSGTAGQKPQLHAQPRGPGAGTLCPKHSIAEEPLRSVAQYTAEQTETGDVKCLPEVTPQGKAPSQAWKPLEHVDCHPTLLPANQVGHTLRKGKESGAISELEMASWS